VGGVPSPRNRELGAMSPWPSTYRAAEGGRGPKIAVRLPSFPPPSTLGPLALGPGRRSEFFDPKVRVTPHSF